MSNLRRLYQSLPSEVQYFAKESYDNIAEFETSIIRRIFDEDMIQTIDRSDLKSCANIGYYTYDGAEQHTFVIPSVPGQDNVIKQAIQARASWRDDLTTIHDIENHEYSVQCHEPFVAELSDVTIFGPHAMVRTADGELPLEVKANIRDNSGSFEAMFRSTVRWYGRVNTVKSILKPRTPDRHFSVATSILTGRKNTNPAYGHWLVEILPRIRGIKHYQNRTGRCPVILVNPNITDWQIETLELVGVDTNNVIKWEGGQASIDRYVLPMWAKSEWCTSHINWVKEQIKNNVDYEQHLDRFSSRVYLSREKMNRRELINRRELVDAVSQYGFEVHTPESLTFAEQVALFENAEILLGPTGSSFTNMIFSTDVDVIELVQPKHFITWFFELSQILGHNHHIIFGDDVGGKDSSNPHHQDFSTSPHNVIGLLERIT